MAQGLKPAKYRTQRNLRLKAGERRPQADMNAMAKSKRSILWPVQIEAVGFGKLRRIAVCRAQTHEDGLTCPDSLAPDLKILLRETCRSLNRAIIAQCFRDRRRDQARVVPQRLELVGMLKKRQHTVPNQMRCRLMTGNEQEDAVR